MSKGVRPFGSHYQIDFSINGKRYRKVIPTRSKKVAEQYRHELIARKLKKETTGFEEIYLSNFIDIYYRYIEHTLGSQYSIKRYKNVIENFRRFINSSTYTTTLNGITREMILEYVFSRQEATDPRDGELISPHTINLELRTLKAFFNEAKKRNYILEHPMVGVKMVSIPETPPKKLTSKQYEMILSYARKRYPNGNRDSFYPLLVTLVYCGLRKSEGINIKWDQIDLENRFILICSHGTFKTKTGKWRVIDMNPTVYEEIRKLKKRSGYVFLSPRGKVYKSCFYRKFKELVRELGLGWVTIHTLRHSLASTLAEKGISLKTIQTILGHSSLSTTLMYQHTTPPEVKQAMNLLPDWRKVHEKV